MNKILTLSILVLCFYSCSNETRKENTRENTEKKETSTPPEQKWKINDEMIVHLKNMESSVLNFEGEELAEYHSLSDSLSKNIKLLLSSCTMKGKAHDALHSWLMPFFDLRDQLAESDDLEIAIDVHQQMKLAFVDFRKKFE